ncbi:MAG: type III pantothenate kinase [bacterium]
MLLAIDIGNTTILFGVYKNDELRGHWRVATDKKKTSDEYGGVISSFIRDKGNISAAIISCVVPSLASVFNQMVKDYFHVEARFVEGTNTKFTILYDNPKEVGADRVVNAIAGFRLYGGPVIVVDFGTATTFDVISKNGEYLGGAIAPGINISIEALWTKTALLPKVEIIKPKTVIGKNTIESMQAGIFYGFVGQVDEIITKIKEELELEPKIVATGGLAELISSASRYIQLVNPLLTLQGLKIIHNEGLVK